MNFKKLVTFVVVALATFGLCVIGRKVYNKVQKVQAEIAKRKEQEGLGV